MSYVATVLTVYGIETLYASLPTVLTRIVATVLTVYGIETYPRTMLPIYLKSCNSTYRLRY